MVVPGRGDAAALLLSLDPPPWFLHHVRAVAEIAGWLALRTRAAGRPVDRRLVESAALLHDVDKLRLADLPVGLPHGVGSARWLADRGYAELGPAVEAHPVVRLLDGPTFERWLATSTLEERIVAYADKRAGQRLESVDARFASWRRRYPVVRGDGEGGWDETTTASVRKRANRLEASVLGPIGTRPEEVARLRWTGAALAAARPSHRKPAR